MNAPEWPDGWTIRIENASPSWKLLMQSGVGVACTVGIPVGKLLETELGLGKENLAAIDTILLDGMPVDNTTTAVVPDKARLALAAGLPGIAGLALKQGSAVRALRGGITHTGSTSAEPGRGRIILSLYSLVIESLGAHFLARGVIVSVAQFRRYARFAPDDICSFKNEAPPASRLSQLLDAIGDTELLLVAGII